MVLSAMVDKAPSEAAVRAEWRSFGSRIAVAGGCFIALVSLFHHVPASTAALRGALAWGGVLALTRFSGWVLMHALRFDAQQAGEKASEEQRV